MCMWNSFVRNEMKMSIEEMQIEITCRWPFR